MSKATQQRDLRGNSDESHRDQSNKRSVSDSEGRAARQYQCDGKFGEPPSPFSAVALEHPPTAVDGRNCSRSVSTQLALGRYLKSWPQHLNLRTSAQPRLAATSQTGVMSSANRRGSIACMSKKLSRLTTSDVFAAGITRSSHGDAPRLLADAERPNATWSIRGQGRLWRCHRSNQVCVPEATGVGYHDGNSHRAPS